MADISSLPREQGLPEHFTGKTSVQYVVKSEQVSSVVGKVTFEKGARTLWHKHTGEQVLCFLEGKGRIVINGETTDTKPGDVITVPSGAKHWHGAHPSETDHMSLVAVTFGESSWLEPLSDNEFHK